MRFEPLMQQLPNGLLVPRRIPMRVLSHIKARTGADHGKVYGPNDRLRRDQIGEKLEQIRLNSLRIKRESGQESGPFQIKDWMK